MPTSVLLEGPDVRTRASVFETYYRTAWPHGSVRMAAFTPDTVGLIGAEPGVRLKQNADGHQVLTVDGWVTVASGDYIVNYGHDITFTAVVGAGYVYEHYTREPFQPNERPTR